MLSASPLHLQKKVGAVALLGCCCASPPCFARVPESVDLREKADLQEKEAQESWTQEELLGHDGQESPGDSFQA